MKYYTIRIYGKRTKITEDEEYFEVEYTEYRNDGTIKGTGTEDFITKRWNSVKAHMVYTWDGTKRNKGGYRWFDYHGIIWHTGTRKQLTEVLRLAKYQNCKLIDLR